MLKNERHHYTLENFEGPLPFLLHLIQRHELDIAQLALRLLPEQFNFEEDDGVDQGAEFISVLATLLLMKSRSLLPVHDDTEIPHQEEHDSPLNMIPHLIEYCRFKEIAKELFEREEQQLAFYSRGCDLLNHPTRKPMGIEHVTLQEFSVLFQEIVKKASHRMGTIYEEVWRVSDKLLAIRENLLSSNRLSLEELFDLNYCKDELIVIFLAVLELMKIGELKIVKDSHSQKIWIEKEYG